MGNNNISPTAERMKRFIRYKGLSARQFQFSIGASVSFVHNICDRVSPSIIKRIEEEYPELNIKWLQEGVGEMLNTDIPIIEKKDELGNTTIPLLPISAQAGSLNHFFESATELQCERIISPVKMADMAIPVTGESMSPEFPNGSQVIVKKINEESFIDWGRTYVLDTANGAVIKNLYPGSSDECLKCVSVNPNFPPFEVKKTDIRGIFRVLMCLSLK